MKQKIIIMFILLIFTEIHSHAQYSSIRIGVMPFFDSNGKSIKSSNSQNVTAEITNALYKYKFIKLVERSMIDEMMKEVEMGMAGIVDNDTAVKIGKVHGLQMIVVGSIRNNRVTARAIYMETQSVVSSTSVADIINVNILAESLASGIEIFLAKENLKTLRNDSPDIKFNFWVEEKDGARSFTITPAKAGQLKIGQTIVFKFKANNDGYLTIIDIQPGGDVVVLFPNDLHPDNNLEKDKVYSIPSVDDGFKITVSEPAGDDTVVAFFTKKKVNWLDRKKLTGEGFWTVKKREKFSMTRGFKISATKLKHAEWESKTIQIKVIK